MSYVVRPARPDDLASVYQIAKSTGGGFTNLPPDRSTLKAKLARAASCFAREEDELQDDLYFFMLEDGATGKICGTCQIFSQIGARWPFYSYRIGALTQYSKELGRSFRAETLTLTTDLEGASEVGGLYLVPGERSAGTGSLLARSRYLFMQMHRPRFADRTIAELRGAHDTTGGSPFWDGVAGRFFGMSFREADDFNAIHGNQFIADLMPKHPLYLAMLTESALAVIGKPHESGRAAMRMLEKEGFVYDNYIDIFDGGPTMSADTDSIATIRDSRVDRVVAIRPTQGGVSSLVAYGRLAQFRVTLADAEPAAGGIILDEATARLIGCDVGDIVTHVPR
ncbi:arginine N-succinyltransferase [Sphingobium sp. DEHP117]|uniref:arginine N-succinyltransferase n=1 Tax=Sphingobium sp. DEHP117 TaxID=2993436 RepID=UPI0027D5B35C|nr:arginine N-succinyltransferase [Sphingobium sp. DEHP117]MDQ4421009.1 arginine N-succinyltransferase [Sphingobium sp. DEHP117]